MVQENNNGFLYFAVGALVIGVAVIGYVIYTDGSPSTDLAVIETSAGDEGNSPDFNFEINEDGVKASGETDSD